MTTTPIGKKRIATVWLCGCSGCHMSFLDLDEKLPEEARQKILKIKDVYTAKAIAL